MNDTDAIQRVVDQIDSIEPGSHRDSAAYILGLVIGAFGLTSVQDAWNRLAERGES